MVFEKCKNVRFGTRSNFMVYMSSVWEIIKQTFWPVEKLIRKAKRRAPFEDAKSLLFARTQHKKPFDSFPICKMICAICLRFYVKIYRIHTLSCVHWECLESENEWADVQHEMLLALIKKYLAHNFFRCRVCTAVCICGMSINNWTIKIKVSSDTFFLQQWTSGFFGECNAEIVHCYIEYFIHTFFSVNEQHRIGTSYYQWIYWKYEKAFKN